MPDRLVFMTTGIVLWQTLVEALSHVPAGTRRVWYLSKSSAELQPSINHPPGNRKSFCSHAAFR